MTVHRLTPLPIGANRGRLLVATAVAQETLHALRRFHGPDGRHEGLLYWLGRRVRDDALVMSLMVPPSDHGRQHVFVAEREVGVMSRVARAVGLSLVAQVHSHPGNDTRHSEGDDRLILMPFEGMFSVVVANYGDGGIVPEEGVGLHQYQDRRWVRIPAGAGALIVIPPYLEHPA